MREAFDGMRDVMCKEPGNEQLVRQASRKVGAAGEEMAVLRAKVEARVLVVLTPEQREDWAEGCMPPPLPKNKERFHAGRELVTEWIDAHAGAGK